MPEQLERVSGTNKPSRDQVQSLQRGLTMLRAFDESHPALTLEEAAARSGISRSAGRRLLRTLMAMGYVSFDGHRYAPTPRLLELGYAQQSRLSVVDVARPYCEELSRHVGRTVSLGRLDGHEVMWVLRVGSSRVLDVLVDVGTRLPAHLPAIGRVLLAWLPEAEIEAFLASDLYQARPARTAPTARELTDELAQIRSRGWSLVEDELEEGLSAIAAPVSLSGGQVVAGLNISTETASRGNARDLAEIINALTSCAERIGADLHRLHLE